MSAVFSCSPVGVGTVDSDANCTLLSIKCRCSVAVERACVSGRVRPGARRRASISLPPLRTFGCLVCPPLRSPFRAARTYVINHCMIIVRILDILMIVSRGGWSREWRGGVRAHLLISAAAARVILIPWTIVLGIIFCFEFDSILKLRRVRIFMYRNCIY